MYTLKKTDLCGQNIGVPKNCVISSIYLYIFINIDTDLAVWNSPVVINIDIYIYL